MVSMDKVNQRGDLRVKSIYSPLPILWTLLLFVPSWVNASAITAYSSVIDAGSSGSRIYLYKTIQKGKKVQVEDLWSLEPQNLPALSDFTERAKQAYDTGIAPLLFPLRAFLGEKGLKPSEVTIHVLATAGLRLLDPSQSKAILGAVSSGLKKTEFRVGRVGVLPSELEGLFAWADLNALLGRLVPGKETLGIVEIGGASAQIAYEVKSPVPESKIWWLQGQPYRIFSRSFLGLGQNAARKSMIHSVGGGLQGNPCYPKGVSVTDKKTGVDGLTGSFDFARCTSLYREVVRTNLRFDRDMLRGVKHLTFAGIGKGTPVGAIQGSISLWGLSGTNPHDSLKMIEPACSSPWVVFQSQFGGYLDNQNQCANSIFIETLLYDPLALGLGAHQLKHVGNVLGRAPSWTRGFLMLPTSEFP